MDCNKKIITEYEEKLEDKKYFENYKEHVKNIFDMYVNTTNNSQFTEQLDEYCCLCNLELSKYDVENLIDLYLIYYGSYEEKMLYYNRVDQRRIYTYIKLCNDFISLPSEKRIHFLLEKNITTVMLKKYFSDYIKHLDSRFVDKERYSNYINKIIDDCDFDMVRSNLKLADRKQKEKSKIDAALKFFNLQFDLGFIDRNTYLNYLTKENKYNLEFKDKYDLKQKYLKMYNQYKRVLLNSKSYKQYYDIRLNDLKNNIYESIVDKVNDFIVGLRDNSYDIIDYYLNFDMPFEHFYTIVCNNLTTYEKEILTKFGILYGFNYNNFKNCSANYNVSISNIDSIKKNRFFFDDNEISDEIKDYVISLMNKYNIPYRFFNNVLVKYCQNPECFVEKRCNLKK